MKEKDKRQLILSGNIYKVLFTLSLPIVLNNLIQTLYNLVDGYFVGMISTAHFAATSFVWPINFLFTSIGLGLSVAGTSILSNIVGKGDIEKANKYYNQLLIITGMVSLLMAIIGFLVSPTIVRIMGADKNILEYGSIYLRITFISLPFQFLFFNLSSAMNSQGNTITPTILSGLSAIVNIVLDKIFILDLNWGIEGAAWATSISIILMALGGVIVVRRGKSQIKSKIRSLRIDRDIAREIRRVAIPQAAGTSGSASGFIVLNSFIGSYGTSTVAAFGMVNRVSGLLMQPAMGFGTALTTIVGQNIGNRNIKRAEEAFRKAALVAIIIGVIGGIILFSFRHEIVTGFIKAQDDLDMIAKAEEYIFYDSFIMPLMGLFSVLGGLFQGSGYTRYSMYMELGRLWFLRLPMILIFKHFTSLGSTGIWISMSLSNLFICIFGYIIYRQGKWKTYRYY